MPFPDNPGELLWMVEECPAIIEDVGPDIIGGGANVIFELDGPGIIEFDGAPMIDKFPGIIDGVDPGIIVVEVPMGIDVEGAGSITEEGPGSVDEEGRGISEGKEPGYWEILANPDVLGSIAAASMSVMGSSVGKMVLS